MHIEEFWQQPFTGTTEDYGPESDWLDLCEVDIVSSQMSIGDPYYFPSTQVVIDVLPGHYFVQARVRTSADQHRISGLRAWMSDQVDRVEPVGDVSVDIGRVMLCDYPAGRAAHLQRNMDDGEDFSGNFLGLFPDQFGAAWLNDVMMPYVQAGWGDGNYPAYGYLDSAGNGIGCEVVFSLDEANPAG
jgi:hypothetical protein